MMLQAQLIIQTLPKMDEAITKYSLASAMIDTLRNEGSIKSEDKDHIEAFQNDVVSLLENVEEFRRVVYSTVRESTDMAIYERINECMNNYTRLKYYSFKNISNILTARQLEQIEEAGIQSLAKAEEEKHFKEFKDAFNLFVTDEKKCEDYLTNEYWSEAATSFSSLKYYKARLAMYVLNRDPSKE